MGTPRKFTRTSHRRIFGEHTKVAFDTKKYRLSKITHFRVMAIASNLGIKPQIVIIDFLTICTKALHSLDN